MEVGENNQHVLGWFLMLPPLVVEAALILGLHGPSPRSLDSDQVVQT